MSDLLRMRWRGLERVQDVDGRDEPGHDAVRVSTRSHFVLDSRCKLGYIVWQICSCRGARSRGVAVWEQTRSCGAASQAAPTGGPGCGPVVGIGLRPPSSRRTPPEAVTGPASPERLNKPCAKRQFGSSLSPHIIEPGCPTRHPRSTFRLAAQRLRAPRCWLFNQPIIEDEHAKPHSRLSGAYDAGMQGSLRLDLRRMIHHEGLQGFYPALALRRGFFM